MSKTRAPVNRGRCSRLALRPHTLLLLLRRARCHAICIAYNALPVDCFYLHVSFAGCGAAAKVQLEGSTRPPWHTLAAVRTTTAGRSCRRVRLSLSAQHASDLNAYPNIQVGRACNALLALAVALACGFTQAFLPLSQHTGFGCARSPQPPHTAAAPFKCRCPTIQTIKLPSPAASLPWSQGARVGNKEACTLKTPSTTSSPQQSPRSSAWASLFWVRGLKRLTTMVTTLSPPW